MFTANQKLTIGSPRLYASTRTSRAASGKRICAGQRPFPDTTAAVRSTKVGAVRDTSSVPQHHQLTHDPTTQPQRAGGPPEARPDRLLQGPPRCGACSGACGMPNWLGIDPLLRAAVGAPGPAPARRRRRRRAPPARAEGSEQNATLIYTQNDFVSHCARSCSALWG